tara:strand:+ start:4603 stop:5673 length:1071 start_codon:yes stop_codon:yes gene_type:complete
MHLTWQAGDPVVQLNFPNPLNVSVQVGDVAYFSNPTPVGQAQPWTATTTPHLSNPQSGIIMIGEIIQIIPWNGTVSSIICNMPQALFNQYFAQIVAGGCILGPSGNPTISGDCGNFTPRTDWPVAMFDNLLNSSGGSFTSSINNAYGGTLEHPFHWYFDNPNTPIYDIMWHGAHEYFNVGYNICTVDPLAKSVNGINDYVNNTATHDYINFWYSPHTIMSSAFAAQNPLQPYLFLSAGSSLTMNDILSDFISYYPTFNYQLGMTYSDFQLEGYPTQIDSDQTNNHFLRFSPGPLQGSYSDTYTEVCTQGSFIMFSKDNKVNMSDMLGYYASVELRNNSKTEAELFNVGTTFFESSK